MSDVAVGDVLKSFDVVNGRLIRMGQAPYTLKYPGASPVVSSDDAHNGVVWVISSSGELIAYSAPDPSSELWSTSRPGYSRFSIPEVTDDGHVEVSAGNVLVGFGLGAST
jgi:hypothetical protein